MQELRGIHTKTMLGEIDSCCFAKKKTTFDFLSFLYFGAYVVLHPNSSLTKINRQMPMLIDTISAECNEWGLGRYPTVPQAG